MNDASIVLAFGPMILEALPKRIKWATELPLLPFSSFKAVAAMEMNILFIAVLFVAACAGFYLPEEEEGRLLDFYWVLISLIVSWFSFRSQLVSPLVYRCSGRIWRWVKEVFFFFNFDSIFIILFKNHPAYNTNITYNKLLATCNVQELS